MAKKFDPKAKAKKQKIYAAIGGVLLLGLLAFQVPRTMKMLHPPNANDAAATTPATTTPTSGPIAAPSLSGGNATAVSATGTGDGFADPDALPLPQSGQLLAFGLFRTKDPFAQQLRPDCAASADSTGTACASGSPTTGTSPPKTTPAPGTSSGIPSGSAPTAPAAPTTAVISVNDNSQSVQVGGRFPTSDPAFTLVSLTAKSAKIGIAGGAFESGSQTVTLKKNKTLTLVNTADGTRYVLRLLSIR
jgi:hypothetical protein